MTEYRQYRLMPIIIASFLNFCIYAFVWKVMASQLLSGNQASFLIVSGSISATVWFFLILSWSKKITVEWSRKTLVLRYVYYPRFFFDVILRRNQHVPFEEIVSISSRCSKMGVRWVVYTKTSVFCFSDTFVHAQKLESIIEKIIQNNEHGKSSIEQRDKAIYKWVTIVGVSVFILVPVILVISWTKV